jgi:simple sugar transport system ATP-binding protein
VSEVAGGVGPASAPALLLDGVSKRYGTRDACLGARLDVRPGTVHALVGENGAGKSTLLKIAYGEVRADAGRIVIGGREVDRGTWTPAAAIARGMGLVHQHFMLVPTLTTIENIVLGREPLAPARRFGLGRVEPLRRLDLEREIQAVRALSARLGLVVWPERPVGELSVGEQQRVEILKVLWRGAKVLLLDEPTAVLSPPETADFLRLLARLKGEGTTCVLCTHRLDEVEKVADAVTVMRHGAVTAELAGRAATTERIVEAMLGRAPAPPRRSPPRPRGEVRLRVHDLTVARPGAADAVARVSLEVRRGEILGIAGVEGNGQSELILALFGLIRPKRGEIDVDGEGLARKAVTARQAAGLAHVPEDRHRHGALLSASVRDNVLLGRQRELGRHGLVDRVRLDALVWKVLDEWGVEPRDPEATFAALSGGNQQKVVVARELLRPGAKVLLLGQPTRGVDVGAAEQIRARILAAADAGVAVLLVSSDLAELRALADRIAVMRKGRIVATVARDDADPERLGELMTGGDGAGRDPSSVGGGAA